MSYQDFLPANWVKDRKSDDHPLAILRREVDDLFDDFGNGFFSRAREVAIHSNISETDHEYCITAELPGMTEADVDVSITGERIVIKGEKKSETEEKSDEKGREFHRIERSSGSFQRSLTLPFKIDPDKVVAKVKDGVLTVTVPKPSEAIAETKKIRVSHA